MATWYESAIDRQIREAQERGEFDNLRGAGRPLRGAGGGYDEDWWLKEYVEREEITGVLPATMLLRKEHEDLPDRVRTLRHEQAVRDAVAALNARIEAARRGHLDGPPVILRPVDAEEMVRRWRER